jgi:cytochrome c biogenesis protein CcdA
MPAIEKEFRGLIEIEYSDITKIENYKLLLSLKEKYKSNIEISLPVFYIDGCFLNGKGKVKNSLKNLVVESLNRPVREGHLPAIDLVARFKNFEPLAIIAAGLIDGINPCAFTVIVFFISFLALQGYRKRELIIIGLSFVFAVFLTYLLIGLGIFSFLYNLKGFWLVARAVNISIGIFSIILGILAIHDLFKLKKTQATEGLFLQLPKAVKNRIHSIIGLHYRKPKEEKAQSACRPRIWILLTSTLITGFLVAILELVCTGQVYLPTITFVLKTAQLKLQALGYLVLYNIMFIAPLFIIFLFALFGATSEQFAKFLKKHLALTKILMAILFFALGIFLLWRA